MPNANGCVKPLNVCIPYPACEIKIRGISIQINNLDKMSDPLFSVRNNFYLGAFNTVLNEAADVENVSELEAIERDAFIYRSYIALGSYEVRHQIHLKRETG